MTSKLLSDEYRYLQDAMNRFVIRATATSHHHGNVVGPRLGVYSLLAESVPMLVYDHPVLLNMCESAFTDGHRVFWSAQFLGRLLFEDMDSRKKGKPTESLLPLFLHELTHVVCMHPQRTRLPPLLGQGMSLAEVVRADEDLYFQKQANEYVVNAQVTALLRELRQTHGEKSYLPGPTFQHGVGVSEEDCDKYFGLAETHVEQLIRMNASPGAQPAFDFGLDDEITPQLLASILESAGCEGIRDEIGLPSSKNVEQHKLRERQVRDRALSAVQKMQQLRREQGEGGASLPGSHLEDYVQRQMRIEGQGRISWRAALREAVIGSGNRYLYTEDVLAPEFFLPPDELGTNIAPYAGLCVPSESAAVVAVIMDTSGSMGSGPGLLFELGAEIAGLARDVGNQVRLAIIPADTAVRGDIQELSADEAQCLTEMRIDGDGGTDFAPVINQVVAHYEYTGLTLAHIVYCTDLEAAAPTRNELAANLPTVTFLTTPEKMSQAFADAVSDWAAVVMIEDHAQIELAHERAHVFDECAPSN